VRANAAGPLRLRRLRRWPDGIPTRAQARGSLQDRSLEWWGWCRLHRALSGVSAASGRAGTRGASSSRPRRRVRFCRVLTWVVSRLGWGRVCAVLLSRNRGGHGDSAWHKGSQTLSISPFESRGSIAILRVGASVVPRKSGTVPGERGRLGPCPLAVPGSVAARSALSTALSRTRRGGGGCHGRTTVYLESRPAEHVCAPYRA